MSVRLELAIGSGVTNGGTIATGMLQLAAGIPLDTTLRAVTDQANTVSPLQLSTTAVNVTSILYVDQDIQWNNNLGYGLKSANGTRVLSITNALMYSTTTPLSLGTSSNDARLHVRGDGTNPIARFEPTSGSNAIFIDSTCTSLSINGTLYSNESVYRSITTDMYSVYNDGTAGTGISFYGSGHATTFLRNKILLRGSFWALGAINDAGAPAIKRNGAEIQFKLADDIAMTRIQCSQLITTNGLFLIASIALTNGAGASTGTITNAPAVGNPTKWIPIDDAGVTRYIPCW